MRVTRAVRLTWVGGARARAGMTPSMGLAGVVFSGGFAQLGDLAIFVVVRASGDGVGAAQPAGEIDVGAAAGDGRAKSVAFRPPPSSCRRHAFGIGGGETRVAARREPGTASQGFGGPV